MCEPVKMADKMVEEKLPQQPNLPAFSEHGNISD